jgi:ubiquinone/menaquinone biosynthesis C-methylase UbiE
MHTTEFDEYAEKYEELVRDPLRDRFAGDATFFTRRKWELLQEYFRRRQVNTAELSWLDVGCGTGTLLRMGSDSFGRACGCDPSDKMLESCREMEVRVQDPPTRLPFDSQSFDLVTMVCVLHHVPLADRAELMGEVARVLRPGGTACVIEHNPWNPVTRLIVSRVPVDRDAILLSPNVSRALLREATLKPLTCQYFLYVPERAYQVLGKLERLAIGLPLGGQYAMFARAG